MRHVRQRYLTDCGIAVAACVAGVGYERMRLKAHEVIWDGEAPSSYITNLAQIKELLSHFDVVVGGTKHVRGGWGKIPDSAVVRIVYANGCGHFVLFNRDGKGRCSCYDPWLDKVRRDIHKMRPPSHYMEVEVFS
jgi:hypothetical protein